MCIRLNTNWLFGFGILFIDFSRFSQPSCLPIVSALGIQTIRRYGLNQFKKQTTQAHIQLGNNLCSTSLLKRPSSINHAVQVHSQFHWWEGRYSHCTLLSAYRTVLILISQDYWAATNEWVWLLRQNGWCASCRRNGLELIRYIRRTADGWWTLLNNCASRNSRAGTPWQKINGFLLSEF